MRRTRVVLALVLLAATACGGAPASGSDSDATAIPLPDLALVDPEVVEAIHAARAELSRDLSSGKAWGALGDRYLVHAFSEEAAACYARAEALDPQSFVWPYRLGWSLINGHPERALAPFERSLRALDDYGPAHEIYAHALVLNGRNDEALAQFTRASELNPSDPYAESGLGQIYLERGDLERAQAHFKEALARDPKHVAAHAGMAQVSLALGQEKKAQNHAALSRSLPPDARRHDVWATPNVPPAGARARTSYGKELELQGRADEAEEQYRRALAVNPDSYAARTSLVQLLVKQGKRAAALALLHEAEVRNPEFAQIRADIERLSRAEDQSASGDAADDGE